MTLGEDSPITVVSMYLPQSGHGQTKFHDALQSTGSLIRSIPQKFRNSRLLIGCDANCSVAPHECASALVGPNTFVSTNGPRAELLMDFLLEFSLRATNTFGPSGDVQWTHEWYPDRSVRSVIDYVLVSTSLDCSCTVDYKLDCSTDHRPLVCTVAERAELPHRCSRKPSSKGWRPANAAAAEQYHEITNTLTPDMSPEEIQQTLVSAAFSVPYTTQIQRCGRRSEKEPPHVLEAREALAHCTSREDRLRWGKLLYRRRRKWLQWLSRKRFAEGAMSLARTDKLSSGRVSWLLDLNGNRSYDVPAWGQEILEPFFGSLYTSSRETLDQKRLRLAELESRARASRLDGCSQPVELPMYVLLEARARMQPNKQSGEDGVVAEMLRELELPALDAIRASFEKRLNAIEGFTDPVPDWNKILVHCIPKLRAAHKVTQLRPISLIAGLAKWYLACLARVIRLHASPPKCCLLGFEPGHQPMELTELCRLLLAKFNEWRLPLFIGKSDAHKAFDSIEHPVLDDSLAKRDVPVLLRAAVLRELVDVTLKVHFQGSTSSPVPLGKGGKQGGGDTPSYWNFVFDDTLSAPVTKWSELGWGADLQDGLPPISHAVWADDLFFFASDFETFATMSQDICSALNEKGLSLKPDSLLYMANDVASEQLPDTFCSSFPVLDSSGTPLWFDRVPALPCLGVLLSPSGDSNTAVEHRITASQQHYWARSPQLQCKGVPKRARIARLYQTVASSLLWGAGGWTLSQSLAARLESLELSFLRRVLQVPRSSEGFVAYMKKSASVSRAALAKYRQPGLLALVLSRIYGWAGHLARLPPHSPVVRALRFRDKAWWRDQQRVLSLGDPRNRTGWRHHRPGRFPQWEDALEAFDVHWPFLAHDRDEWRSMRPRFVELELIRLGSKNSWGAGACDPAPASLPLARLSPGPSPATSKFSSSVLPTPWESGLNASSLSGVSATCGGLCPRVQSLLLGSARDSDAYSSELKKRIFPALLSVATSLRISPTAVLHTTTPVELAVPSELAQEALEKCHSREAFHGWPTVSVPYKTKNVSLRATYAGRCAGNGSGGAGICLLLSSGSQTFEIYRSSIYLGGHCCSATSAQFQALGIGLLALASLLNSLAGWRREALDPAQHNPFALAATELRAERA